MTTPNLEQIAANAPVSSHEDSINRVVTWMTGRLMQEHDRNTTLSILRRKLEEHYERLAALRAVAPQPAKTEEVRRAVDATIAFADMPPAFTCGQAQALRDRLLSALTPYLRTDREPCQDTVRLDLLADQLARNYAVSFFNTGNGVQLFSGGFLNGEGKDFRAAIDAAASANDGRARG